MSALLLVFSEPSQDQTDEDHSPLRNSTPEIQTAVSLTATDETKPTWGDIYTVNNLEFFQSPAYQRFVEAGIRRQKEEKEVRVIDRRIYRLISERSKLGLGSGDASLKVVHTFVFVSMTPSPGYEDEFDKWYEEEHTGMLALVPGWLRTRRYELVEPIVLGPPKMLAVHEYEEFNGLQGSVELDRARNTPWRTKVMQHIDARERREFKVLRVWK